jgi:AraC-like DNA-binding protein
MLARVERNARPAASSFVWKRRRDPRFDFSWHFHPEVELTLILRSRGRRFVGDHLEPYGDGDLVLLGPELPHTWHSDPGRRGPHEAVVVQFPLGFLGPGFLERPELGPVRGLLRRAARGLSFSGEAQRTAARRLVEMGALAPLPRLRALLEVLEILSRARGARPLSSAGFASAARKEDVERIDRVLRFLAERFTEEVSLPQAARAVPLSVPAFSRFFKRRTGKTFVRYLTELRVGHASRLLIETDRTVSDIAFSSGFNNLSNFNRRFREVEGMSPRDYRKAHEPPA